MLRVYSDRKAEQILDACRDTLQKLEFTVGVPAPCLRAVLFWEITHIDILDLPADLAVRFYWFRYRLRKKLGMNPVPRLRKGPFGKRDSSTGYGQIFAAVGIRAIRFALAHGFSLTELGLPDRPPDETGEELYRVWLRLHRDHDFNLTLSALNLLSAAEERTGSGDFAGMSPEELKTTFTRYNTTAPGITAYGEEVYGYYLRFRSRSDRKETP